MRRSLVKASCSFVRLKRNGAVQKNSQSKVMILVGLTRSLNSAIHRVLCTARWGVLKQNYQSVCLGERRADNHRMWLRARENFTNIRSGLFSLSQNNITPLKAPSQPWLTLYVCMYVCMHACMPFYVIHCMYVCMHACMHVCMTFYVTHCMYVCTHIVCMYVCMYV